MLRSYVEYFEKVKKAKIKIVSKTKEKIKTIQRKNLKSKLDLSAVIFLVESEKKNKL